MENNQKYKELFELYGEKIKLVDKKATFFISINSLLIAAVAIFNDKLQTWSLITLLVLLLVSAILFIIATFPILWNKYEKNKMNPIHLPTIWKKKSMSEFKASINKEITEDNYLTQIKRLVEINKKKYFILISGICILSISLITFIVIILVTFLS